jgi:tetratricopeptide (TPR) repeat protein
MKRLSLIFCFCFSSLLLQAQNTLENTIEEGIKLHDRGDFKAAIAKYDEVLAADPVHLRGLTEKALSLLSLGELDKAIELCEKALQFHPGKPGLKTVYVTYGNALDMKKEPKRSIKIYDKGIEAFPDDYQLHFNRGITLSGLEKYNDATASFQASVKLNPAHASSHNAMARIAQFNNQRVPAILAFSRFVALEWRGERAKQNAGKLLTLLNAGAKETGNNEVTITLSSATVKQASGKGKKKENDFSGADMMLSLGSALDYDEKNKNKTPAQQLERKLESLFGYFSDTQKGNSGFFWEYYVPYFVEMKAKSLLEPFSNIVLAAHGEEKSIQWVNLHEAEVKAFLAWSGGYQWQE